MCDADKGCATQARALTYHLNLSHGMFIVSLGPQGDAVRSPIMGVVLTSSQVGHQPFKLPAKLLITVVEECLLHESSKNEKWSSIWQWQWQWQWLSSAGS
jgi:hypothetical protein